MTEEEIDDSNFDDSKKMFIMSLPFATSMMKKAIHYFDFDDSFNFYQSWLMEELYQFLEYVMLFMDAEGHILHIIKSSIAGYSEHVEKFLTDSKDLSMEYFSELFEDMYEKFLSKMDIQLYFPVENLSIIFVFYTTFITASVVLSIYIITASDRVYNILTKIGSFITCKIMNLMIILFRLVLKPFQMSLDFAKLMLYGIPKRTFSMISNILTSKNHETSDIISTKSSKNDIKTLETSKDLTEKQDIIDPTLSKKIIELQKRQDNSFHKQSKEFNKHKEELKQQREEMRMQYDQLMKSFNHQKDVQIQHMNLIIERIKSIEEQTKSDYFLDVNAHSDNSLSSKIEEKCLICFENPLELALQPCGHVCTCQKCGSKLPGECPMCRKKIQRTLKIYFP